MWMFMVMLEGRIMRRLEWHWIFHQLLLNSMYFAEFPSSLELIAMSFVRLYLDLIREAFSGVRLWFTILIWNSVELWSDLSPWLQWGKKGGGAAWFEGDCRRELSWSSLPIIVGAGTGMMWTGIYSARPELRLIDSMRLQRLVTLLIAAGALMIVPRLMFCDVRSRLMCLAQSQMFLLFVLLVVHLFQIRWGRLSCWVRGLKVSSHETLLSLQTCHPRLAFCGIAFRPREVERHLMVLDLDGGVDPSGCFPIYMFSFSKDCFYSCPETESTFS